jgi:ectoine hydroxylase-related dioxygenase (phytanoyl-CoA dioxygenase family)
MISAAVNPKLRFQTEGYCLVKGLFSQEECDAYLAHYMELRKHPRSGDLAFESSASPVDPLTQFPRMINMHRWDVVSMKFLLDARLEKLLTEMTGEQAYAVQTMLYFKPAGARGQALHQDQFYLKVEPGTCVAAWLALDPIDEENGCMCVVPGSQNLPILCTIKSDVTKSFTDVTVPVPESLEAVPVIMDAGDVLFFNGSVIHGSGPNVSKDRFRRSLIAHYATGDAQKLGTWYEAIDFKGNPVSLEPNAGGTKCGQWVDQNGEPVVELVDKEAHDLRDLRD